MLDGHIHPDYADVAATLIRQIPKDRHAGSAGDSTTFGFVGKADTKDGAIYLVLK